LPIYCFDDSHFETTQYGLKKAAIELSFTRIINDLDASLRKMGSGLLILKGKPEVEIQKLWKNIKSIKFLRNVK
jgi:deoxyribodipyrimidine photo-lyase